MNEMIGAIISLIFGVASISVVVIVVYLIVAAIKNKDEKKKSFEISAKTLFQIYLYIISFLTLAIALFGGATAIKASLSYAFDIPFSYTLYRGNNFEETAKYDPTILEEGFEVCTDGEPIVIGENEYCINYQLQKTDLINGLTIFVSMVILFLLHQYAISKISMKERLPWLNKFYTFASLILYSIIGLISIPTAIYQLTNYLITEPINYTYSTPEAPAMAIGIVLLSLPLWIFFLNKTSNIKEEE